MNRATHTSPLPEVNETSKTKLIDIIKSIDVKANPNLDLNLLSEAVRVIDDLGGRIKVDKGANYNLTHPFHSDIVRKNYNQPYAYVHQFTK